jgi:serine phosphatase RsbU (regulator of sigma subunit)
MKPFEVKLDRELRAGAHYLAQCLTPEAGAIPRIPNVDFHGVTIPLNGIVGGDLITFVDFSERFDLDTRIAGALAKGQEDIAQKLQKLKRKGGILVADVSGHEFSDAIRAMILHQVFHMGALFELAARGEITTRLIEQVNTRFCKSKTLRNLAAVDLEPTNFITLIYGEISVTGRFRFVTAGHPPPLVFSREYDRFVDIRPDRLVSYPPLGLQLNEDNADARMYQPALGYKKRYAVNELNLLNHGDVLLLYTDGLTDPFSSYTQARLERTVSRARNGSAKQICEAILEDRKLSVKQTDDLSLVVIKYIGKKNETRP